MPRPKSLISVSVATAAVFGSAGLATADDAVAYGHGICGKVAGSRSYADLVGGVKSDFNTADDYHGAYLINQAVNELCPALIWQLRDSAAEYRPAAAP